MIINLKSSHCSETCQLKREKELRNQVEIEHRLVNVVLKIVVVINEKGDIVTNHRTVVDHQVAHHQQAVRLQVIQAVN